MLKIKNKLKYFFSKKYKYIKRLEKLKKTDVERKNK